MPSEAVYSSPFFSVSQDRTCSFHLGLRPTHLGGGKVPTSRDLEMHVTFLDRLGRSPLRRAQEYQRQMQEISTRSVREFARKTGED